MTKQIIVEFNVTLLVNFSLFGTLIEWNLLLMFRGNQVIKLIQIRSRHWLWMLFQLLDVFMLHFLLLWNGWLNVENLFRLNYLYCVLLLRSISSWGSMLALVWLFESFVKLSLDFSNHRVDIERRSSFILLLFCISFQFSLFHLFLFLFRFLRFRWRGRRWWWRRRRWGGGRRGWGIDFKDGSFAQELSLLSLFDNFLLFFQSFSVTRLLDWHTKEGFRRFVCGRVVLLDKFVYDWLKFNDLIGVKSLLNSGVGRKHEVILCAKIQVPRIDTRSESKLETLICKFKKIFDWLILRIWNYE